jgi:hypothetical protein
MKEQCEPVIFERFENPLANVTIEIDAAVFYSNEAIHRKTAVQLCVEGYALVVQCVCLLRDQPSAIDMLKH